MMFSRLKGVLESHIDTQIQQEQARTRSQRSGSPAAHRTVSRAKNGAAAAAAAGREKDPSEFENESDASSITTLTPSRVGTPIQGEAVAEDPSGTGAIGKENDRPAGGGAVVAEKKEPPARGASPAPGASSSSNMELPTDVRVKLRKLEKIESRHNDLLRSYKIVHARNALIEPFEKALRENTPFESIGDPKPLIDYINSFALRADLAREELIRVSKERDEHKLQIQKLDDDRSAQDEEVNKLKKAMASANASPRRQPEKPSDDIFSFDDEHDKLHARTEEQESEIEDLKEHLAAARAAQKAAEEAVGCMQQDVENSQKELEGLRESGLLKDQAIEGLNKEVKEKTVLLEEKTKLAEARSKEAAEKAREARNKAEELAEKSSELSKKATDLEEKRKELRERDSLVSQYKRDVETSRRVIGELERKVAGNGEMMKQLMTSSKELSELREAKTTLQQAVGNLEGKLREAQRKLSSSTKPNGDSVVAPREPEQGVPAGMGKNARKNKKKKGRGRGAQGPASTTEDGPTIDSEIVDNELEPAPAPETGFISESIIADLQGQLSTLRQQLDEKDAEISKFNTELQEQLDAKEAQISKLQSKARDAEELQEEIDFLRDDLSNLGEEHVEAMDKLKQQTKELREARALKEDLEQKVESMVSVLKAKLSSSSTETEKAHTSLKSDHENLKQRASTLQTDLSAAQQLAAIRYKDLMEVRVMMEKAQPELVALRAEVATLTAGRNEANQKLVELKRLERSERDLRNDITSLNKKISEKESEVEKFRTKIREEAARRVQAEEATKRTQRDLRKAEDEVKEVLEAADKSAKDYQRAQEEINILKPKIGALEKDIRGLKEDKITLKEELELKVAQYTSSQSLMGSMRDQTGELAMQMKEAVEKCESMEEELSESHRLLAERSREAETMRRLLAEVEGRNETRTREMKERMEAAFDERDKAEEEASTIGRRRAREMEELKDRVREADRGQKRVEEARENAERELTAYKEGKRRTEETLARVQKEYEETKIAMGRMRDALDQTDSQIEEIERQKADLRKSTEEAHARHDKLQKSHKILQDELRSLQAVRAKGRTDHQTSRSSIDSARSGRGSPTSSTAGNQLVNMDYLKNVLLQFLEQKDKKTQLQLVPVLGMLLKFDKKDEQKWTAVVSAK